MLGILSFVYSFFKIVCYNEFDFYSKIRFGGALMREKVRTFIESENLFSRNDCVIVGLSGGPDSIALLHLLNELVGPLELSLVAVHIHHGIRGVYADRDAEFVKLFCAQAKVPVEVYHRDIPKESKLLGISLEEAGRMARYECFEEALTKWNGNKIAVAHHQNDQAETVLMRLIRGSGLDGLTAMVPKRGYLVRPLLQVTRSEIEHYCSENHLKTIHDETNDEAVFQRNKIRLELIPWIESNMNPRIVNTLSDMATLLESDRTFMEEQTIQSFSQCFLPIEEGQYKAFVKTFNLLHKAIQRRVIRHIIEKLDTLKSVSAIQIEEVIHLINMGIHGKEKNVGGVLFKISYDYILTSRIEWRSKQHVLEVTYLDKKDFDVTLLNSNEIAIDANCVVGSLRLRYRQEGDLFQPLGMKQHKKIKKFFIDLKIPEKEREQIPIIEDEREVVWICPYRLAEPYRITSQTVKIAILSVHEVV